MRLEWITPTFMVGLAFVLLCILLAWPLWKAVQGQLYQHAHQVNDQFLRAKSLLKQAKEHHETTQQQLEASKDQGKITLQNLEERLQHMEETFQKELEHITSREVSRLQTQRETLLDDWRQQAWVHLIQEVRIVLQENCKGNADLERAAQQQLLKNLNQHFNS